MRYKQGIDNKQQSLIPKALDEYISQDNICRVIHAYTQTLDITQLGFKHAIPNQTGNRPYDPKMILNLYLYGYLHRIRSSRRLQAETTKNIEVMWLLNQLQPDDKTIANFRSDNTYALKQTFRAFTLLLNNWGLYSKQTTATDGCKFRANNSRKNNHNPTTLKEKLKRIDKQITQHLNAIEKNDQEDEKTNQEVHQLSVEQRQELIKKLKDKKVNYEKLLEQAKKDCEVSTTDSDSRLMRSGGDNRPLDVCYNAITTTEAKHKLIVDFELTNKSNGSGSLHLLSEKAKTVMGVEKLTQLADKGFSDGSDLAACEVSGVTCLVASPQRGSKKSEGVGRDRFSYDATLDCYVCPGGHQLGFRRLEKHKGEMYRAYENYTVCRSCSCRVKCTKGPYRRIVRSPHAEVLEIVDGRTRSDVVLYKSRSQIVEHPFGVVKAV